MLAAGLQTWTDALGNVHGRLAAKDDKAPVLLMGSHYDTVIDGGRFDGALGVLVAVAAVKALHVEVRLCCYQSWQLAWQHSRQPGRLCMGSKLSYMPGWCVTAKLGMPELCAQLYLRHACLQRAEGCQARQIGW